MTASKPAGSILPVIPIFVSSTFRDFHDERDCLHRFVRPRLDDVARPYGCRVELVDLRWGVDTTEDDEAAAEDRVVSVCASEIDRARPLFLGLLGDRVGTSLNRSITSAGPAFDGCSITEQEIRYALAGEQPSSAVLLRRRSSGPVPNFSRGADGERVDGFLAELPSERCWREEYSVTFDGDHVDARALEVWSERVIELLSPLVASRAGVLAGSPMDDYESAAHLYVEHRASHCVGRGDEIERTVAALRDGRSVCLVGDPGIGVSTVWSAVVARLVELGATVNSHVVGVTPESRWEESMLRRLLRGAGSPGESAGVDELRQCFRAHPAYSATYVAVDHLEQILPQDAARRLAFVRRSGSGDPMLCATSDRGHSSWLATRGFLEVPVGQLGTAEQREIAIAHANARSKQLPEQTLGILLSERRTPLWLVLAVTRLAALGGGELGTAVGGMSTIVEVLRRAAEGLPADSAGVAAHALHAAVEASGGSTGGISAVIALSRRGVAPADLPGICGVAAREVALFRLAASDLLVATGVDGKLQFAHSIVRGAAEGMIDQPVVWHRRLAAHFALLGDEWLTETVWHAVHGGDYGPINAALHAAGSVQRIERTLDVLDDLARTPDALLECYVNQAAIDPTAAKVLAFWLGARSVGTVRADVRRRLADGLWSASAPWCDDSAFATIVELVGQVAAQAAFDTGDQEAATKYLELVLAAKTNRNRSDRSA